MSCLYHASFGSERDSAVAVALCPCRMMVFGVLTLVLSWTSLGADLATAVVSCPPLLLPPSLTPSSPTSDCNQQNTDLQSVLVGPDSGDEWL